MSGRRVSIALGAILLLGIFIFGQQKEQSLSLSLEDCILGALKNNLSLAVEILNPELADLSVLRAQEKYMPNLSLSYRRRNTNSASYSWLDAADVVITDQDDFSGQISQLIPTGGRFSLLVDSYKTDTNRQFQTINPRFGSTLTFNFTQPLLKDFGFTVNRREIIIAQNRLDMSENQLQKALLDTIYTVEEAYWNLVYSIENLKVRKHSLKLAQELLEKNLRAVEVGTMAPIDVLSARAEVATREADILQAEALVKNNEDRLKMIINLAGESETWSPEIIPSDKPRFEERIVGLEEALIAAMENRPDLQSTRIDLKNQEVNLTYARNQLLPGLNLTASYWSPGVSGDQILYLNNNPLTGVIIGRVPGGPSDSLKDAVNLKYKNWSVGLTLDIPLSNFLSRAALAQEKVNMEQALLRLQNQEKQVYLEIKNAIRTVQTTFKQVQAYKIARELAETKLEAEEEKLRVGLSTNYFVLMYQRELANARSAELRAVIDYNLSLASLERAMGTTLKARNIQMADFMKTGK